MTRDDIAQALRESPEWDNHDYWIGLRYAVKLIAPWSED